MKDKEVAAPVWHGLLAGGSSAIVSRLFTCEFMINHVLLEK